MYVQKLSKCITSDFTYYPWFPESKSYHYQIIHNIKVENCIYVSKYIYVIHLNENKLHICWITTGISQFKYIIFTFCLTWVQTAIFLCSNLFFFGKFRHILWNTIWVLRNPQKHFLKKCSWYEHFSIKHYRHISFRNEQSLLSFSQISWRGRFDPVTCILICTMQQFAVVI